MIVIYFHRTSGTHVYVGFYNHGVEDTGVEAAVKTVPTDAVKARAERHNERKMLVHLKHNNIAVFHVRLYIFLIKFIITLINA